MLQDWFYEDDQSYEEDSIASKNPLLGPNEIKELKRKSLEEKVKEYPELGDTLTFACYGLSGRDALLNYVEKTVSTYQSAKEGITFGLFMGGCMFGLAGVTSYLLYLGLQSDSSYSNILRGMVPLNLMLSFGFGFWGVTTIFSTITSAIEILRWRNKLLPVYEELERELKNCKENTKDEDLYNLYKKTLEKYDVEPMSYSHLVTEVRDFNMILRRRERSLYYRRPL